MNRPGHHRDGTPYDGAARGAEDWLMGELRWQKCGDCQYMLGPGKWLAEQLERYSRGLTAHEAPIAQARKTRTELMLEEM